MANLKLLTLPDSPHNTKIRLALKLKGLAFESVPVDFRDRARVVECSGQPLTPVLLDGERVVYDSFGILRYLDANWPEPRLFSATREGQRAIQTWERFAVDGVGPILGMLVGMFLEGRVAPEVLATVRERLEVLPERVETALQGAPYLGGEAPNAADLTVAPFFRGAWADPASLAEGTPMRFVAEHSELPARFVRTRAWVARIMEIDRLEPAAGA